MNKLKEILRYAQNDNGSGVVYGSKGAGKARALTAPTALLALSFRMDTPSGGEMRNLFPQHFTL